jgi:hypothetical protein
LGVDLAGVGSASSNQQDPPTAASALPMEPAVRACPGLGRAIGPDSGPPLPTRTTPVEERPG